MKRFLMTCAAFAMVVGGASGAQADQGEVHVTNCVGQRILVCAFNGDDSVTLVEVDFDRVKDGHQATLKCDKGGKGGCKIKMAKDAGSTCGARKGKLFDGRHDGYFKILGKGDDDLVEITKDVYESDDPCG